MEQEPPKDELPEVHESVVKGSLAEINRLPERLGYIETAELTVLRREIIASMVLGNFEEIKAFYARYAQLSDAILGQVPAEQQARAHIGLQIISASIRRDAGWIEDYLEEMHELHTNISQQGLDDLLPAIEEAIDEAEAHEAPSPNPEARDHYIGSKGIANMLSHYGSDYGIYEQTVTQIAELPLEQALVAATHILREAGLDAEVLLAPYKTD